MKLRCISYAPWFVTCFVFPAASKVAPNSDFSRKLSVPLSSCTPAVSTLSDFVDNSVSPRNHVCRQIPVGMKPEELTLYTFSNRRHSKEISSLIGEKKSIVRVETTRVQHIWLQGGRLETRRGVLDELKTKLAKTKLEGASSIEMQSIMQQLENVLSHKKGISGSSCLPNVRVLEISIELLRRKNDLPKQDAPLVLLKKKSAKPCDITYDLCGCNVIDFKNGYLMVPDDYCSDREQRLQFQYFDEVEIVRGREREALQPILDKIPDLKGILFVEEEVSSLSLEE